MKKQWVALLGRQDSPTDAVEEYCQFLGAALQEHQAQLNLVRVAWPERGWPTAVRELETHARQWRGRWVFVQYTALAWSERGFPLRFLRVLRVLRESGARIAMVYHDVLPFHGNRTIDKLRRRAQVHVMHEALDFCDVGIFTVPVSKIPWVGQTPSRCVFIPVGANLRDQEKSVETRGDGKNSLPTIAVYGITGGQGGVWEIANISEALHMVTDRLGRVRLVTMGRNSEAGTKALRNLIEKLPVDIVSLGLLPTDEIARQLTACDVLLFVRGGISSRRGSAIAGIACGLPIVGFEGPETASPITEAGIVFADSKRQEGLGEALLKVLSDPECRQALAERSRRAQESHFSWKAIAKKYVEAVGSD